MAYTQIIDGCLEQKIGDSGISGELFSSSLKKAKDAATIIRQQVADGNFPIFNELENDDSLAETIETANRLLEEFDELVVLGTGGSTLNPQAISALTQAHSGIDKRVYFIDTMDPFVIDSYIEQLDLETTAFLVSSKSGGTVETLAQFLIFLNEYKKLGTEFPGGHFFIISDPKDNPLRQMATKIGATILDHEELIGGRFSTFTNVGLIPAMVAGVDIEKFRAGAKEALQNFIKSDDNQAIVSAALAIAFMEKGTNTSVVMPYTDRLVAFSTWYRQIWAESLGKAGKGSTMIRAVGSLDQHSQLQLYLDGPKDKYFTVITVDTKNKGAKIALDFDGISNVGYIKNKTAGDINAALQQATANTLVNNKCPVRQIQIGKLDEKTLGNLMLNMILETILTAQILEIDAFDQPAVEEGKVLARDILKAK